MSTLSPAEVLQREVDILTKAVRDAASKVSAVEKVCVDKIADLEREKNTLLTRAGVYQEYEDLMARKSAALKLKEEDLRKINDFIESALRISNYLTQRVETLRKNDSGA